MLTSLVVWALVGQIRPVVSDDFSDKKQVEAVLATVRIWNRTSTNVGSGVILGIETDSVYVLSAAHLAERSDDLAIEVFTKKTYPEAAAKYVDVRIIARDAPQDLLLIEITTRQKMPGVVKLCPVKDLPISTTKFTALSVGCGDGAAPLCKLANVQGAKEVKRSKDDLPALVWEMTPAPITGRSGGPLFDREGKLIGICSGTSGDKGYFVHPKPILAFLEKYSKRLNLARFWE